MGSRVNAVAAPIYGSAGDRQGSRKDEPVFFRAIDTLGVVFGSLPCSAMLKMIGMATKQARVPADRRAELLADFRKNDPRVLRQGIRGYLKFLGRYDSPAVRLCDAGVPTWVVHAEKGDGGLTDDERRTLEARPHTSVITIPGTSYFIANEEPERVAELVVEALGRAS
jgi:pimeloyl-ACP methyl ester carboxylesterase